MVAAAAAAGTGDVPRSRRGNGETYAVLYSAVPYDMGWWVGWRILAGEPDDGFEK